MIVIIVILDSNSCIVCLPSPTIPQSCHPPPATTTEDKEGEVSDFFCLFRHCMSFRGFRLWGEYPSTGLVSSLQEQLPCPQLLLCDPSSFKHKKSINCNARHSVYNLLSRPASVAPRILIIKSLEGGQGGFLLIPSLPGTRK